VVQERDVEHIIGCPRTSSFQRTNQPTTALASPNTERTNERQQAQTPGSSRTPCIRLSTSPRSSRVVRRALVAFRPDVIHVQDRTNLSRLARDK
jgi:hypothetical protein